MISVLAVLATLATAKFSFADVSSIQRLDPEKFCAGLESAPGTAHAACLDYVEMTNLKSSSQTIAPAPRPVPDVSESDSVR